MLRRILRVLFASGGTCLASQAYAQAQLSDEIAAPGEIIVAGFHAEGAQIYECKADGNGKLAWQFREPIAALIADGKTVGRHYGGPTWELADGSAVAGKLVSKSPGKTAKDIPWLKLSVASARGSGQLSGVTTIQRINTVGGVAEGLCDKAGSFQSVAYSSDYVFLKKNRP